MSKTDVQENEIIISCKYKQAMKRKRHDTGAISGSFGRYLCVCLKWERGVATPELNLIAEMADLFEMSIDALIGYEFRNNDRENVIARLKQYSHDRNNDDIFSNIEKALRRYRMNHSLIGETLASSCNDPEGGAMPYLSMALLNLTVMHMDVVMGYLNVFCKTKDHLSALALVDWALAFYPRLKNPKKRCYMDKNEAFLWAIRADIQMSLYKNEDAINSLRQAKDIALRFDEAPNYSALSIRFVSSQIPATAFDDLGDAAMIGIDNYIVSQEKSELLDLWRRFKMNNTYKVRRKKYMAQFYKRNHAAFLIALFSTLLIAALNLWIAWVMQQTIDSVSGFRGLLIFPFWLCLLLVRLYPALCLKW